MIELDAFSPLWSREAILHAWQWCYVPAVSVLATRSMILPVGGAVTSLEWVLNMQECLPMPTREELLQRFSLGMDDPEVMTRRQHILEVLLEADPQLRQRLREESVLEGRVTEARVVLRRVLVRRQLTLSNDDDARIETCTDLPTLQRWLDQAVTAVSISEAMA